MRTLRRKGYNEINHLFKTLVLPNLLHALAVYGRPQNLTSPLYKASFIAVLNISSVLNIAMFTTFWKHKTVTFSRKYLPL